MIKRKCRAVLCQVLVAERPYCAAHGSDRETLRGSARARGYDREWERARAVHLAANPMCAEHLRRGQMAPGEDVDHIRPFRGKGDPLRLEASNLQTLCRPCHVRKSRGLQGAA